MWESSDSAGWGQYHGENLAGRLPGVELVRVVDARDDVAASTGQRLGVPFDGANTVGAPAGGVTEVAHADSRIRPFR